MADIGTVSEIMHEGRRPECIISLTVPISSMCTRAWVITNLLHCYFEGFGLLKIAYRTMLNYQLVAVKTDSMPLSDCVN